MMEKQKPNNDKSHEQRRNRVRARIIRRRDNPKPQKSPETKSWRQAGPTQPEPTSSFFTSFSQSDKQDEVKKPKKQPNGTPQTKQSNGKSQQPKQANVKPAKPVNINESQNKDDTNLQKQSSQKFQKQVNSKPPKQEPKRQNINKKYFRILPRRLRFSERLLFSHQPRSSFCLCQPGKEHLEVAKLQSEEIRSILAFNCRTIEHQILALRQNVQLNRQDFDKRYRFTQLFLDCLQRHHDIIYEGILFGSSVNGLGFRDSDVDLRIRPLKLVGDNVYEPMRLDSDMIDRILKDIAYQTTICCPAYGDFVPSSRCPIAKLCFIKNLDNYKEVYDNDLGDLDESLKYDVSLSSTNTLGTFNSMFLRFLCHLEPKFHILATFLRYWSNVHQLVVPGYLSSYALCNMLIFFCQTITPPILPTIDYMRELYFKHNEQQDNRLEKGLSQLEWHCIVCLKKEFYSPSTNKEPLSVLLLKFFEFYLNFPYSTHIITTRPGRALTHDEFSKSTQYHRRFPKNTYLTIQDPFDLSHNLTSGMQGGHFRKILATMRHSYETLYKELLNNFSGPDSQTINAGGQRTMGKKGNFKCDPRIDWGLNALLVPINPSIIGDMFHNEPKQETPDLKDIVES